MGRSLMTQSRYSVVVSACYTKEIIILKKKNPAKYDDGSIIYFLDHHFLTNFKSINDSACINMVSVFNKDANAIIQTRIIIIIYHTVVITN